MNITNLKPDKPFTFERLFELLKILSNYHGEKNCSYNISFYSVDHVLREVFVDFSFDGLKGDLLQKGLVDEEKYKSTTFDIISVDYIGGEINVKLQMLNSFFVNTPQTETLDKSTREILKEIYGNC